MVGMMAQRLKFVGLALVLLREELSAFVQVTLDLSRNMGWRDKQFTNCVLCKKGEGRTEQRGSDLQSLLQL